MALADVNAILRAFLITQPGIVALVGPRIYSPILPKGAALPAITFFVRGGTSSPYIPGLVEPSFQIDSWANNPIGARQVYREIYSSLQGYEGNGYIKSVVEEVQGQDLGEEPNGYFRCLAFFKFIIDA